MAVGDGPCGPFRPEPKPIAGSFSIDPACFVDEDGMAFLYFGGIWEGNCSVGRRVALTTTCQDRRSRRVTFLRCYRGSHR